MIFFLKLNSIGFIDKLESFTFETSVESEYELLMESIKVKYNLIENTVENENPKIEVEFAKQLHLLV
jgi:hypothetical protein